MLRTIVVCCLLAVAWSQNNASKSMDWIENYRKEIDEETGKKGWALLGEYCFGYSSNGISGKIDLRMEIFDKTKPKPDGIEILFFDNEPSSWQGFSRLPSTASCKDRKSYAKDRNEVDKYFTAVFEDTPDSYTYVLPSPIEFTETNPRYWYLVAIRCVKEDDEDIIKPIPPLSYDVRFSELQGIYFQGSGPSQCSFDAPETNVAAIVFVVIFILADLVLVFMLYRKWRTTKAGTYAKPAGQEDDDDTGLDLDRTDMLGGTMRSDA